MADIKSLMKLTEQELITAGSQVGLTFHHGMKKSQMVQQLQASVASGWMDVNAGLVGSEVDEEFGGGFYGDSSTISDAARIATSLSNSGMTETFHAAMNGPSHHVEAVRHYMSQLGVSSDDVWMHMPKANPNVQPMHFNALNNYLRDNLTAHQDIMPQIAGHYSGNIMDEYSTNLGGVSQSYEHLAHMYLDKSGYDSANSYNHDVSVVAQKLGRVMGGQIHEVAAAVAGGAHVSYMSALPHIGDPAVVGSARSPRMPLNVLGLPMGQAFSGATPAQANEYSLSASLTGSPGWTPQSKEVYKDISESVRSLAKVYGGDTGMNARPHITSDRDMIMDSASRYVDVFDARHGYDNLKMDLADDPRYSGSAIRSVIENAVSYNEADPTPTFDPAPRALPSLPSLTGTDFSASFGSPTDYNSARARREAIAIANYDSIPWRDVADGNTGSPVHYHDDVQQGTEKWLKMREQYDVTGSTVGTFLGNNPYTRPWAGMIDKIGLSRKKEDSEKDNSFQQRIFDNGHKWEEIARGRVSNELGIDIKQTGAITNDKYPAFMYSPDGLIGDDAIWEHKNPETAGKFADLRAGDHPDYMDQIQFGMLVSGRSRALFSQTLRGETRSEWFDRDENWFDKNRDRIDSVLGRLDAGRAFVRSNGESIGGRELIDGARKAMQGDGIWKDVSQKSNRGFSASAGVSGEDPFMGRRQVESEFESNYVPNFTIPAQNMPVPVGAGGAESTSMALSVKEGILAAQDENRRRGAVGFPQQEADADFDDMLYSGSAGGGGSRSGGGGGRRGGGGWNTGGNFYSDFGPAGGAIARGIAGGSMASATGGAMQALMTTPWGRAAAVGIGALQIGNEAAEFMNDFVGNSLDAGLTNPNEFSSISQGMEVLGANSQQANQLNVTTHSAYNTMLNGDPSGAIRIVKGSRGLLTIGDIRNAKGDTVELARIARERAKERGWGQDRFAGAMEMAGLNGMARTYDRTNETFEAAGEVVQHGRDSDVYSGVEEVERLNSERARVLPSYIVPQYGLAHESELFSAGADAVAAVRIAGSGIMDGIISAAESGKPTGSFRGIGKKSGEELVSAVPSGIYDFLASAESSNREYNADGTRVTSPTGARGRYQILPSTAKDPGFGLRPSDGSAADDARLARELYGAMYERYGDHRKAMAAYTDGAGTVDSAIKQAEKNHKDWTNYIPTQALNRVSAYDKWSHKLSQGAGEFVGSGSGSSTTNVNINLNATIDGKSMTATVSSPQGGTTSQTVNMRNGAMSRR